VGAVCMDYVCVRRVRID